MIGVIDYGSGNLRSVSRALEKAGATVRFVNSREGLDGLDAVVLPGVGSFGDSVSNLEKYQLMEPLREWIQADKPFFGICLGYQLLFESSEESPGIKGLGVFEGVVRRFENQGLKIPHMGWNTLKFREPRHAAWEGISDEDSVYFVHSYYPCPSDERLIAADCEYGSDFAACIAKDRLVATQFHPEKSQAVGLRMLQNFVNSLL